ncbi:monovalent cation/H(+) antiporter subunit G [Microlunatus ginsengisoli]|uniref:Monovalent cation/H(+) antiporter subunit G n=1 Tax=Microlunatus ginsengisoli TaxID=363863 RepID=A0ABP6ZRC9_9ACTN
MSWSLVADILGALFLLLGALLCFAAAVGLLRFPDVLSRMHAATKPQTLGLLLLVAGVALEVRQPKVLGLLFLVAVLQLLTAPVSAHMVGRTAYRTHQVDDDSLIADELADDLARAGFRRVDSDDVPDAVADPDREA